MNKKIIIMSTFIAILLIPSMLRSEIIYRQDFDGLNDGALNGQDGWSGSTNFIVGQQDASFGGKAVRIVTDALTRTIQRDGIAFGIPGSVSVSMRANGTDGNAKFTTQTGVSSITSIRFNANTNKIEARFDTTWTEVSSYTDNVWYNVKIKWENDTFFTACVEDTICKTGKNIVTGTPDKITMSVDDGTDMITLYDNVKAFDTFNPSSIIITHPENITWTIWTMDNESLNQFVYSFPNVSANNVTNSTYYIDDSFPITGPAYSTYYNASPYDFNEYHNTSEKNLVLAMHFNQNYGLWIKDDSVNSLNGIYSGENLSHGTTHNATYVSGYFGNAMNFTGKAYSYVNLTDTDTLNFNETKPFTITAWIKPEQNNETGDIISRYNTGVTGTYIFYMKSGYLRMLREQDAGSPYFIWGNSDGYRLNKSRWYHVAGTYNGTDMMIYVNGTSVADPVASGTITEGPGTDVLMGSQFVSSEISHVRAFNGTIDSVRIWNRSLSQAEIMKEMGSWLPQISADLVATYNFDEGIGQTVYDRHIWSQGKHGPGLNLDGVDDYVIVTRNAKLEPENITVAFWANFRNITQINNRLVSRFDGGGYSFHVNSYGDTNNIRVFVRNGSLTAHANISIGHLQPDTWHHFAMTYDWHNITTYLDGVEANGTSLIGGIGYGGNTPDLFIGAEADGNSPSASGGGNFNGSIDEVLIFNRSMNADEIKNLYDKKLSHGSHFVLVNSTGNVTEIENTKRVFTTKTTAEIRVNGLAPLTEVQNFTITIENASNSRTITTTSFHANFPLIEMPLGSVTIQVLDRTNSWRNTTISDTVSKFEGFNKTFDLNPLGFFNITLWDEIGKRPFAENLSTIDAKKIILKVFCPTQEVELNVSNYTSELHNLSIACPIERTCVKLQYKTSSLVPERCLIPSTTEGELKFWVWENISVDLVYLQPFKISDLVGTFKDGSLTIQKLINNSVEIMHQANFAPDGTTDGYLVDTEWYLLKIVSEDRASEKNLPAFNALASQAATDAVLEATELVFNPAFSLLYTSTSWSFSHDDVTGLLSLVYRDELNQTTSITYTVRNATNMSHFFFTTTSTDRRKQYDFSYDASGNMNSTYHVSFVTTHLAFGTISKSVIENFGVRRVFLRGIDENWYPVIAIFLMISTAFLFGAKFSGFAGLVVSMEGALFYIWGWFSVGGTEIIAIVVILFSVVLSVMTTLKEGEQT